MSAPLEIVVVDNGSEAARREFVVSIDDDCEAATDMLERVGIEFWKLVSTRLAIPWIARVARRACRGAGVAR